MTRGSRIGTVNLSRRVGRMQSIGNGYQVYCQPMLQISSQTWERLRATPEGRCDLIRSLTEMRRQLVVETDARVLLG